MSKMAALDYHDPWELLAEKSHSTPTFLRQLNPAVTNLVVGTTLTLPNLEGTRKLPPIGTSRVQCDCSCAKDRKSTRLNSSH